TIKDVAIELKDVRRSLRPAGVDTTVPPMTESTVSSHLMTETDSRQVSTGATSTPAASFSARPSSAEYLISGIGRHKVVAILSLIVVAIGIAALVFYLRPRNS